MKSRSVLFMLFVILAMIVLAACGGAPAATEAPAAIEAPAIGFDEFGAVEQSAERQLMGRPFQNPPMLCFASSHMAAFEMGIHGGQGIITVIQNTNRRSSRTRTSVAGQGYGCGCQSLHSIIYDGRVPRQLAHAGIRITYGNN